jgi:hypothetical protein
VMGPKASVLCCFVISAKTNFLWDGFVALTIPTAGAYSRALYP